jgi:hypothetical protein
MPATAQSAAATTVSPAQGLDRDLLARLLAAAGIAGTMLAIVLVGALHLVPGTASISPIGRTISEYALTDLGWAFNAGAVALALGSLCVFAALVVAGRARRGSLGVALGVLWSAALLVVVMFPKHNWAIGPSTNGQIHRVASIVAFLCLPLAVLLLTRRTGSGSTKGPRQPPAARTAFWLGVLSLAWFSLIIGALLLTPITGTPWYRAIPLGLVERGLVLTEVAAVTALGVWAFTSTRRNRNPQRASPAPTGPAS